MFYPATDAPKFHKGMIAMLCTCAATLGVMWLVWLLERREWRIYGHPGHIEKATVTDPKGDRGYEEDNSSPIEKDTPLHNEA